MEPLSEAKWDVLISGTGLQNSLLALALSRSNKKVLHVDGNEYYGGTEAAFSLQDVDKWIGTTNNTSSKPFRNVSLWKKDSSNDDKKRLSFSRAYTLALSPQIIYTKSKLLAQLVSSKVYRQLEFQAVGNWWILGASGAISLKRLPNGREDIFQDKSIDNRAKRGLMKFLKFVVDYENQPGLWETHAEMGLAEFLSTKFQLPHTLQTVISALTLSLNSPQDTSVRWALPRIARHLTSIGVFGPGFGAVLPKWGGNAEIAQVACRAGAVGGGIYILGAGVEDSKPFTEDSEQFERAQLSNGESVRTRHIISDPETEITTSKTVSKLITIVSSGLLSLFHNSVEGSPLAAVSVIVIPSQTLEIEGGIQSNPIYIMAHSSETGECPDGQCILYATTLYSEQSKTFLNLAVSSFLGTIEIGEVDLLYKLYYEQESKTRVAADGQVVISEASIDLAFNDEILEAVETQWKNIMGSEANQSIFMKFDDREQHEDEEDDEY